MVLIKIIGPVLKIVRFLRKHGPKIHAAWETIKALVDIIKDLGKDKAEAEIKRFVLKRLKKNLIILLVQVVILSATLFISTYLKNPWPFRIAVWAVIVWNVYNIPVGLHRAIQFWNKYKKFKPILKFLEVSLIESVMTPAIIFLLITFGILFLLRASLVYSFGAESFRELLRYLFSLKEVIKI